MVAYKIPHLSNSYALRSAFLHGKYRYTYENVSAMRMNSRVMGTAGTVDKALTTVRKLGLDLMLPFIGSMVLHKLPNFFEMVFISVKWEAAWE